MEDQIESFIRFLAVERGLSENYQLSTQRSVGEFAQWCAAKKKITQTRSVTLPMLSEYLADRKRAGLSAASIKLIVVALKIFFRFLAAKRLIERDPAEPLALPRIERYLPETLNELQVEQLLEKIDTSAVHGLRDRAIIELLYASGLRISELTNARLENFNFEERIVRVTGKGNKTRLVPVGRKACEALAAYLSSGTAKACEAAHWQRNFSFRARHEINDSADMADCEETCAARGTGKERLSSPSPAQLRDASARKRRRSAHYPGDAGACRHFNNAGVHACRSATAQGRAPEIPSTRVGMDAALPRKLSGVGGSAPTYQVSIDRLSVIEYPASTLMTQLFL